MDNKPFASIITPFHCWNSYRQKSIVRAISSLERQSYPNFEHIIINDGSVEPFDYPAHPWIKLIKQDHLERVNALRTGMEAATGDVFCFLDSDDEYKPTYLQEVRDMFLRFPNYKMFNFGCEYLHKDGGITFRAPFHPKKLKVGHEKFGGGNIVNGTFVFHRSVYNDLGGYPPEHTPVSAEQLAELNYTLAPQLSVSSPYDFSALAQIQFPEIRPYFQTDEPDKVIKELGNPWGNDFYLWYKYTRKYHSKPMKTYLYQVHPKGGNE